MTRTTKSANVSTTMTTDRPTPRPRRQRHVARSARILSTGLSATAILGITAAFGAADRAQSSAADQTPVVDPAVTSGPSALAPLGAETAATPSLTPAVSQFPSPEGTITLPTGGPTRASVGSSNKNVSATGSGASNVATISDTAIENGATTPVMAAPADSVAPVVDETVPVVASPAATQAPAPTTPATVAPIAPAEPPVQLTLPPAPSNGSSGGSR